MTLTVDELLTNDTAADAVADFMIQTGLLGQFQAVDEMATGRALQEGSKEGPTLLYEGQSDCFCQHGASRVRHGSGVLLAVRLTQKSDLTGGGVLF